ADDDLGGTDTHGFSIDVTDPIDNPPSLTVTSGIAEVGEGDTLVAAVGDALASLNLDFAVSDPDLDDTLLLTATVAGSELLDGFAEAEWQATGTGGLISAAPSSGTFIDTGTVTIELLADDQAGGTDELSFSIEVGPAANRPPVLAAPLASGDIDLAGEDPDYTALALVGGDLGLTFVAADLDENATLAISVEVTGGSLSAEKAGFTGDFPSLPVGNLSPHAVGLSGTAKAQGSIELAVTADDGRGGTDAYTLTLTIDKGEGCGCGSADGSPPGAVVLAALLVLVLRRRKEGA
ncbi:MAG: MYXO-CTERM sorting domain-containing protein, partial [Deltaproteobacteria bacterium]|nr:MYXO-CTERM sorting domain-containing protein [Deltaproteobacteria bacterium]